MQDIRNRTLRGLSLLLLTSLAGCRSGNPAPAAPESPAGAPEARFVEITARVGLSDAPAAWPDGTYFVPEIMGAGVALLDYDGDDDLDLLQVRFPPPGRPREEAPNRLYRQQSDGSFTDVTATSGLGDPGYGQGVAVGDVDDDGDPDVFFANLGADALYLNRSDGSFAPAPPTPGFEQDRWSSAATFCDYDRDGDLDLYVVHYLRYRFQERCARGGTGEDYCSPSSFGGVPDALYRNEGGGRFREVTAAAGIALPDAGRSAKGLGVVCLDLTGDGWPDFYVANDGEMNQLWANRGDGTFAEEAIPRGVAVNRQGAPEASMGIAVGDIDGDENVDLFMTHLSQETNTLYRGTAGPLWQDRSIESGLSLHDLALTGFGCGFFDYDQDGDLDLALVNGRIHRGPALPGARLSAFWNRYAEPNLLFDNDGAGNFTNSSAQGGAFTSQIEVSRGLAFGDLDDDGDPDLVLTNGDGLLRLFRNDAPPADHHWLRLRALTGERHALGARVTVMASGRRFVRWVLTGYSYQSSSDPRAHVGLGPIDRVDGVEVLWPDGRTELFEAPGVDAEVVLRQGHGASG